MKRIPILLVGLLLSAAVVAQSEKVLTILHTNDTHSCIMPQSTHLADTLQAGRGGFLRRIAMLKEERRKDPDLLLFDSGDFSQGSPYYTLFKGDVESGLMNLMHYDAGTIGNHEFDFGLENMARVFRRLNYPIVCANYKFNEFGLDRIVKPYVILERKGIKIGVFGLSGWEEEGVCDEDLISQTRGIDLVLGGHSHSYFTKLHYANNLDGKPVPVDQNGKNAIYIGRIEARFSR